MHKILLFILTVSISNTILAAPKSADADSTQKKKGRSFRTHSAEIQITPSADYHLYQQGNAFFADEPYKGTYPFIGAGFGVQYIFRPIKMLSISTGIQFRMLGQYQRQREFPLIGNSYIKYAGSTHQMFISVPLYIHLYKKMTDCTFEFAIGPDFNIPIAMRSSGKSYAQNGTETGTNSEFNTYTTTQMKEGASFGISMFLGGELMINEHADIFVGPQIQFLNLARFNGDLRKVERTTGRFFDAGLGLKIGFRIH